MKHTSACNTALRLYMSLLAGLLASVSNAKSDSKRPPVDPSKTLKVTYSYSDWNKNSAKIDSAAVLMKDATTGRLVQIHLDETGPDTATFAGRYSVSWASLEKITPEMYIPPQDLVQSQEGLRQITQMIEKKELKRRPFILRKDSEGSQILEIYDTREQVERALESYRQQARLAKAQARLKFEDKPSEVDIEGQQLLKEKIEKQRLAREALAREAERLRLEQIERQRLDRIIEDMRSLSASEVNARKLRSQQLADKAMVEYRAGHNPEAEQLFRQSVDLYPLNHEHYFQYAVTLYKNNKFNESLVYLRMADSPSIKQTERKYYFALNYMKLKEIDASLKSLREVKAANDPDISPSAAFYEGVVLFDDRQYNKARGSFQECLDTSNDPRLDETAEAYIEQIARIMAFEAERAKRFILTGSLGVQYDSNVLLTSDATRSSTPSNTEAERYNFSTGLEWRHAYERTYEFSTKYFLSTQYSVVGNQEDPNIKKADVSMLTLYAPYRYKGLLFGKGYKLEVSPGFERIMMALEKENRDAPILTSYVLKVSNTLVNRDNWFSIYNFEIHKDNSELVASVGDDDSTAMKYVVGVSNIVMVGKERTKMINVDLGYSRNNAEGRNSLYTRMDLGTGYRQPVFWEMSWNAGLAYYQLNYSDAVTPRKENNYTLTTGFTKPVNSWLQAVSSFAYTKNECAEANDKRYNKFTALLSLVAAKSF